MGTPILHPQGTRSAIWGGGEAVLAGMGHQFCILKLQDSTFKAQESRLWVFEFIVYFEKTYDIHPSLNRAFG